MISKKLGFTDQNFILRAKNLKKIGKSQGFCPLNVIVCLEKIFLPKNMVWDFIYDLLATNSEILKQIRGSQKIVFFRPHDPLTALPPYADDTPHT